MGLKRKGFLHYEKTGDWYFDGYERKIVSDGNGSRSRKVFVYKGAYYGFGLDPTGLSRLKLAFAVLLVTYIVIFLYISASPFAVNNVPYVGIPNLIIIVPLIYLGMGVSCLCAAKPEMPIRSMFGSVRRIKRALYFAIPLNAVVLSVDTVFLVINRGNIVLEQELQFLIGSALCLTALAGMALLLLRFPCRTIEEPEKNRSACETKKVAKQGINTL